MKTVILCGGQGSRMGNNEIPKSLFLVGDKPILWHIMKIYNYWGFNDFVICLGYKGDKIEKYFSEVKDFKVKCVDTGLDTNTGGRIRRIKDCINEDCFFCTYGDGLANINLKSLLSFHREVKKFATITAVKPQSPFGIMKIDDSINSVIGFEEKPQLRQWINGGFFVFNREIFSFIEENDILEKHSFDRLIECKNIAAYKHNGFWECMDTYKDNIRLNEFWENGSVPWVYKGGK